MSMIVVTESAARQIKRLLDQEGKTDSHALRMKVVGGGCSGLQYQLAFDDQVRDGDTEIESGACACAWTRRAPSTWSGPRSTTSTR